VTIPANYNLLAAIDLLFPGVVVQQNLLEAANARLVAKNAALDSSDVIGILVATANYDQAVAGYVPTKAAVYAAALPTAPTKLPRFPDGYGGMEATDGWSIQQDDKVVRGR